MRDREFMNSLIENVSLLLSEMTSLNRRVNELENQLKHKSGKEKDSSGKKCKIIEMKIVKK